MTIGTIEVFKLPASLITGDYPVFSSPSATLSTYLTTTFSNAKFTKDFQQRIVLAEFDGWQSANMVRLTSGSWVAWYWITDRSAQTGINSAIEYAIEYNPVSSLLTKSSSVTGYWTRTPTNISPWKQQAVMSGAMKPNRSIWFSNAIYTDTQGVSGRIFWVQITTSEQIGGSSNRLCTYGFPIGVADYGSSGGLLFQAFVTGDDYTTVQGTFPTLIDIINDATCIGVSDVQNSVTDISISPILPYDWECRTTNGYVWFNLKNYADIQPAALQDSGASKVCYLIRGANYIPWKQRINDDGAYTAFTDMEISCGQLTVQDPQGQDVGSIPLQWADSSNRIRYWTQCIDDFNQMTIRIHVGDQSSEFNRAVFQIPTMHVPYVGTAWQTYQAYSQAFDREAVESNIAYAREALNVQTNASIANGVLGAVGKALSGDIGGAVSGLLGTGIQTATNYRLQDISDAQARYNQNLTERRIQAQPATVYAVAYGITYVQICMDKLAGFMLYMPAGLTSTIFDDYVERYGYSAEGKATLSIDTGYYQGQILPTSTIAGGEYDRLNETFMRGIHITEV